MAKLEITNMVMVQNLNTEEVVVQNRIKNWCGISFPGGHAENGETIYDSSIREIKEETGLDIWKLKPCGFIYWFNNQTEEGKVFWTNIDKLEGMELAPNFKEYLPFFLKDTYTEAYCSWNENMKSDISKENPWGIVYR